LTTTADQSIGLPDAGFGQTAEHSEIERESGLSEHRKRRIAGLFGEIRSPIAPSIARTRGGSVAAILNSLFEAFFFGEEFQHASDSFLRRKLAGLAGAAS
jgi:hypothetical protein